MGNKKYLCIREFSNWPFIPGEIYVSTISITDWARFIGIDENNMTTGYNFYTNAYKFQNSFVEIKFKYEK